MELKEGMYVRTEYGIAKITEKEDDYISCDNTIMRSYGENFYSWSISGLEFLKEPSYNITDLIEAGDYVNGRLVCKIDEEDYLYLIGFDADGNYYEESLRNIKSIVTKEQFESMSYKVGE